MLVLYFIILLYAYINIDIVRSSFDYYFGKTNHTKQTLVKSAQFGYFYAPMVGNIMAANQRIVTYF